MLMITYSMSADAVEPDGRHSQQEAGVAMEIIWIKSENMNWLSFLTTLSQPSSDTYRLFLQVALDKSVC